MPSAANGAADSACVLGRDGTLAASVSKMLGHGGSSETVSLSEAPELARVASSLELTSSFGPDAMIAQPFALSARFLPARTVPTFAFVVVPALTAPTFALVEVVALSVGHSSAEVTVFPAILVCTLIVRYPRVECN